MPIVADIIRTVAKNAVIPAIVKRMQDKNVLPTGAQKEIAKADPGMVAVEAIAQSEDVVLTTIKPMRKSVEGWLAVGGAAVTLVNQLGPALGITVDPVVSDAVETITATFGLPVGTGKFVVAAGTVGLFGVLWVRRKWFTHSLTPAAADRAVANGKAI